MYILLYSMVNLWYRNKILVSCILLRGQSAAFELPIKTVKWNLLTCESCGTTTLISIDRIHTGCPIQTWVTLTFIYGYVTRVACPTIYKQNLHAISAFKESKKLRTVDSLVGLEHKRRSTFFLWSSSHGSETQSAQFQCVRVGFIHTYICWFFQWTLSSWIMWKTQIAFCYVNENMA